MRSEHDKTVHELLSLDAKLYQEDPAAFIKDKRRQMAEAVENLDFETAALLRDEIYALEGKDSPRKGASPRGRKRR
jgi:protein-arginine kinase activator protein McsA